LARLIVEDDWPIARAAERYDVSWPTAKRWADRYRKFGAAGMNDASSRPHHSPNRLPAPVVRKIVHLRWKQRLGPVQIADRVGVAPSTVHKVLVRCQINRLAHVDRATGDPIRRYEHDHPGSLLHQDVKKLGNIPDGGGWRVHGQQAGRRNRQATITAAGRSRYRNPIIGYSYLHTAIDDHSRLAYSEILADERKETAAAFWARAHAWFTTAGITIERVMTDNGSCYRSRLWRDALAAAGITHKRIRPYRPQTNGKVERFNRTLLDEWAYARPYASETQRRAAFDTWLHTYNHHRGHTALGGHPPASRVTNLSGQNT
jgi:transposase InsO family protein